MRTSIRRLARLFQLLSVGGIILWLLGTSTNGVYNFYSDVPAFQLYPFLVISCVGICYLAFQIALRLRNVPWIFMIASLLCCLFFVITTRQVELKNELLKKNSTATHMQPPSPRLSMAVLSGNSFLWLTNETFLPEKIIKNTDFPMVLRVPVNSSEELPQLSLVVGNDVLGTEARVTEILFGHDEALEIFANYDRDYGMKWRNGVNVDEQDMKLVIITLPLPLTGKSIVELPPLLFPNAKSHINEAIFTRVYLRSLDTHPSGLAFWIVFRKSTNSSDIEPTLIRMHPQLFPQSNVFRLDFNNP